MAHTKNGTSSILSEYVVNPILTKALVHVLLAKSSATLFPDLPMAVRSGVRVVYADFKAADLSSVFVGGHARPAGCCGQCLEPPSLLQQTGERYWHLLLAPSHSRSTASSLCRPIVPPLLLLPGAFLMSATYYTEDQFFFRLRFFLRKGISFRGYLHLTCSPTSRLPTSCSV